MKEVQVKINVNFRMLPFGYAYIVVKGHEEEKETKKEGVPIYIEPKTTNLQLIEITFGGENYIVPKVTGGFL